MIVRTCNTEYLGRTVMGICIPDNATKVRLLPAVCWLGRMMWTAADHLCHCSSDSFTPSSCWQSQSVCSLGVTYALSKLLGICLHQTQLHLWITSSCGLQSTQPSCTFTTSVLFLVLAASSSLDDQCNCLLIFFKRLFPSLDTSFQKLSLAEHKLRVLLKFITGPN